MNSYTASVFLLVLLVLTACQPAATVEPDASAMLARGERLMLAGGEDSLRQAIDVFERCAAAVPDYAPCYAGIARAYASIGGNYNIVSPDSSWPAARQAAEKAVELDDTLPEAHVAMAEVLAGQDWNWTAADQEFQRAVELAPNNIGGLTSYGWHLLNTGRLDEAKATLGRIRQIDPEHVDPFLEYWITADAETGKQAAAGLIAAEPEHPGGYWFSANIHAREGEYEQAASQLLKQIPLMNGDVVDEVALLGFVYARMGREDEARNQLARLDDVAEAGRYVSPVNRAWIHAGLGDADETFALLREGVESRAHRSGQGIASFAFVFEPVSDDPRFEEVLADIGLAD